LIYKEPSQTSKKRAKERHHLKNCPLANISKFDDTMSWLRNVRKRAD
jgi:hypothetical protein